MKIFCGNLSEHTKSDDIRELFEEYGEVTECDVLSRYGFVVSFLFVHFGWKWQFPMFSAAINQWRPSSNTSRHRFPLLSALFFKKNTVFGTIPRTTVLHSYSFLCVSNTSRHSTIVCVIFQKEHSVWDDS